VRRDAQQSALAEEVLRLFSFHRAAGLMKPNSVTPQV
jgi:hypothetical protein